MDSIRHQSKNRQRKFWRYFISQTRSLLSQMDKEIQHWKSGCRYMEAQNNSLRSSVDALSKELKAYEDRDRQLVKLSEELREKNLVCGGGYHVGPAVQYFRGRVS